LRLHRLERDQRKGIWTYLKKKEVALLKKRLGRLERYLHGLKGMRVLPGVLIIIGQSAEITAVNECHKMRLVLISSLDTDCDPSLVHVGVPINDDSKERIKLFLTLLVPSIIEGYLKFSILKTVEKLKSKSYKKIEYNVLHPFFNNIDFDRPFCLESKTNFKKYFFYYLWFNLIFLMLRNCL
jgi:ribosomal protein S2